MHIYSLVVDLQCVIPEIILNSFLCICALLKQFYTVKILYKLIENEFMCLLFAVSTMYISF